MSLVLALTLALAASPPQLAEGVALYQSLEFEKATIVLQKLVLDGSVPARDRAEAFLWLGLAYGQLGDTDGARDAFRRSVALDPTLQAPPDSPPALLAMLEDEHKRATSAPPPSAPPAAPPEPKSAPVERTTEPASGSTFLHTAALSSTIGGAVLAVAAAGAGGYGAWQLSIAYDLKVPAKPALQAYATATTCGIAAAVLGGAAVLAGGGGIAVLALE